MAAAIFQSIPT